MEEMINSSGAAPVRRPVEQGSEWNRRIVVVVVTLVCVALAAAGLFVVKYATNNGYQPLPASTHSLYPTGVVDAAEPSGVAPPGATALAGYHLAYVNDFNGSKLPSGWNVFTGVPAGDPGGQFGRSHVVVDHGMLELNTWRDPQYQNRWVDGGLCQCELARTYGAYFIRSRVTGGGANEVQLLWPANDRWPPEIDFNETGGSVTGTSSTLHWGAINQIDQRFVQINVTKWHTWGLVWTPHSITYIVDGQVWGNITVSAEITHEPMTLDFEQIAHCSEHRECPSRPVSMQIDWVAEYAPK